MLDHPGWVVREGFPEEETLRGDLGGEELTGGTDSHGRFTRSHRMPSPIQLIESSKRLQGTSTLMTPIFQKGKLRNRMVKESTG